MKINQTFKSFDEFERYFLQWQKDTFQNFTVTKSEKFTVEEEERETLVYKKATYGCVHGEKRKQQSEGHRPQQRTRKLNCRFKMQIPKLWHKFRSLDAPSKSKSPTKKSKK